MVSTLETIDPSPFKHLIMTIGELPSSFVDSMSYYEMLAWLCNYLENTVIPAVNENAEATNELQEKFVELKSYVDNYFDDLDVQEEINNKLDEMVEDGTFTTLLTPIVGSAIEDLSTEVTNTLDAYDGRIDAVEDDVATASVLPYTVKTDKIRKENYSRYEKVNFPTGLSSNLTSIVTAFKNGEKNYYADFNRDNFVNSGGTTYYLSTTGSDSNDGLSEAAPFATFMKFNTTASAGDTLIVLEGIYSKDQFNSASGNGILHNGYNIIGKGKVYITSQGVNYSWSDEGGGVYSTTRSGVRTVYDITDIENNKTSEYTKASTSGECTDTPMSWYQDGSTIYVHTPNGTEPNINNTILGLGTSNPNIKFNTPVANTKLYIKNINFIDSDRGNIVAENDTSYTVNILIEDCKLFNNRSNGYVGDSFTNKGCTSVCKNVKVFNSGKDGFNYHAGSTNQAYGVEIDCSAYNLGYGQTATDRLSNNSTTAHDSCEVIRINGNYGYCNGGVCVDVGTSKGVYYNCIAIDSYGRSYDIYASDTATIYVYDCYCKGSRATTNLLTSTNAHLYYNDGTEYDTKGGNAEPLV